MLRITRESERVARIRFNGLCGNGLTFARRETLRAARKLHLVANRTVFCDVIEVHIYSHKDENRLNELWKYVTGKRFQRRMLNNSWWRE